MSAQSSYLNKKGLTVKDLVTIGIFTALFFVFELIGSLPFAPNPALTFYQPFMRPGRTTWKPSLFSKRSSV